MTFKHAKFEDSAIMRSLERVAREKGMIKEEPLQKTASTHINLTPSNSLIENILNLCAGLRVSGFDKYADELENNFLAYKRATNELYQTDPKAGEKEIETAHPKGSHKLEDVAGDDLAVVEDILDQHLKMLDIINKKPTGKLESSAEVLSAVKKALGQAAAPTAPVAPKTPETLVNAGVDKIRRSVNLILEQSDIGRHAVYIKDYMQDLESASKNTSAAGLMEINTVTARILAFASTGNQGAFSRYTTSWLDWATAGISDKPLATYDGLKNLLDGGFQMDPGLLKQALLGINEGIKLFHQAQTTLSSQFKEAPEPAVPSPAPNKVLAEIKSAQMALAGISGLVNAERRRADPNEVKNVDKWIKETSEDLSDLEKNYARMNPDDALSALRKITVDFPAVKRDWS